MHAQVTFPAAGEYYVTVQGYDETQLGSYTVAVRTEAAGGGGRGAEGGRGGGPDFCSGGAPIELVRRRLEFGVWRLEWSRAQAIRGRKQPLREMRPPDNARPSSRTGRTL